MSVLQVRHTTTQIRGMTYRSADELIGREVQAADIPDLHGCPLDSRWRIVRVLLNLDDPRVFTLERIDS